MADRLTNSEINQSLETLDGWVCAETGSAITKSFKFKNFKQAWKFMGRCAVLAEKINHHPEWCNIYNKVDILLTTHDAGGITQKDIEMAQAINQYSQE